MSPADAPYQSRGNLVPFLRTPERSQSRKMGSAKAQEDRGSWFISRAFRHTQDNRDIHHSREHVSSTYAAECHRTAGSWPGTLGPSCGAPHSLRAWQWRKVATLTESSTTTSLFAMTVSPRLFPVPSIHPRRRTGTERVSNIARTRPVKERANGTVRYRDHAQLGHTSPRPCRGVITRTKPSSTLFRFVSIHVGLIPVSRRAESACFGLDILQDAGTTREPRNCVVRKMTSAGRTEERAWLSAGAIA